MQYTPRRLRLKEKTVPIDGWAAWLYFLGF